jgi:hypothetical protein
VRTRSHRGTSDEYVISVKGDVYHSFRPYLIRYGRETWRESTLVKAKETAWNGMPLYAQNGWHRMITTRRAVVDDAEAR